jgi:hypothetical protein
MNSGFFVLACLALALGAYLTISSLVSLLG